MIRWMLAAALAVAAGCGGKQAPKQEPVTEPAPIAAAPPPAADECVTFVDRSRPVLTKIGQDLGKVITEEDFASLLAECRAGVEADREHLACVNGAADEPGVAACWEKAFRSYADDKPAGP
jgi:hypothetical protein